ncbi:hypothetical protein EV640_104241 [Nesterenkonia aurantiaca]|uniref:Uncharacterized protein n=1 Tax=Nesterenkonia aurantiaca TaxID=1436010 RepID=A0A4R7G486_9MICC|nr:hypothetical protein EV640_104241 [Nesterenkonia aurantiaca]
MLLNNASVPQQQCVAVVHSFGRPESSSVRPFLCFRAHSIPCLIVPDPCFAPITAARPPVPLKAVSWDGPAHVIQGEPRTYA